MNDPGAQAAELARRALGEDRYAALWGAVRRRLERNGISLEGTPLRVDVSTDAEREAVCGLLGTSTAGAAPPRVRLVELDAILRRGAARIGLVELVELLGGPLTDRRARRATDRDITAGAWRTVAEHPALTRHPGLATWVERVRRSGAATRVAAGRVAGALLVGEVLGVVADLPADGVLLAVLAARHTGDAHALDRDRPLGRLASDAVAALGGGSDEGLSAVEQWRARWAAVGVYCDDVSTSVLVLNLPVLRSQGAVGAAIAAHDEDGEPLRLTLRQVLGGVVLNPAVELSVCENPAVLAAAARALGAACRPLICVDGQPSSATVALLRTAARQGCRLRYHGDFDWGGLRIANDVMALTGAVPWRFSTQDYVGSTPGARVALAVRPAGLAARWDPHLADAMARRGLAVHEEQVVETLIADLEKP